ncbi:MAG: hypothetical protein ACLQU3_26150 [Limisphaerales bacterium]
MKTRTLLASVLGFCAWAGVAIHADRTRAALPYADIYQRATNEFAEACFFKPAEAKTNDLAFMLAPLILQEVNGAPEPLSRQDWFGTLSLSNGLLALDCPRPAIYWQADTVRLKGKEHARFAYVWCYSPGASGHGESALALQGIRITLSSAGQPVVWEALADSSGAELIFVSQSLEAAALAEFGKALPARRYAIERSVEEAPNVVVARVIDDGPVAMGPFVYLSAGTQAVSTLICRCMPAQAKKLRATSAYDLLPFQAMAAQPFLTQAKVLAREQTTFWPGDQRSDGRLAHCLRLPPTF